jgi:hypothetical protein
LVLDAQPLDDRAIQVGGLPSRSSSAKIFGLRVEVGEMVAPAFDFACGGGDGFGLQSPCAGPLLPCDPPYAVKGTGKGFGGIGAGGNPVLESGARSIEVGEHRVGQAAPDRFHPATRCRTGQVRGSKS